MAKKNHWKNRKPEFWFGLFQTISAVALLSIAIWGVFFSDFSELMEDELRASLALAKMDVVELRQEKEALGKEIGVAKAILGDIRAQLGSARHERAIFLNDLKNERVGHLVDRIQSKIRSAEVDIDNAESFPDFLRWIEPLLSGKDIDFEYGQERNFYWIAPAMNLQFQKASWIFSNIEQNEINRRSHKYIEDQFRNELYYSMQSPTGEYIRFPPVIGLDLLIEIKRKKYLGHMREEDTAALFAEVDAFIEQNNDILRRAISFEIASPNVPNDKIAIQSENARRNLGSLKELLREFEALVREYRLG